MSTKILKVESVEIKILKSNPPQVLIESGGLVSTTGWTNPQLILSKKAPVDGIYEFDFCATPPTGMVAQIIVPIQASYHFEEIPEDFKGVRVNSATNSIEQLNGVEEDVENQQAPSLENILGIEMVDDKLNIRVHSNGCTSKESFKVNVIKGFTGLPPYILEVYRVKPDWCRMYVPNGIVLEYTLAELGIEPNADFHLSNKIGKLV